MLKRNLVFTTIIVLLIISGIYFFISNKHETAQKKVIPSSTPIVELNANSGSLTLQYSELKESALVEKDKNFKVEIIADSTKKQVTGYDAVILYDDKKIDPVSWTNGNESYLLIADKKPGQLRLSGVKKIESKLPTIFERSVIAQIEFMTLSEGSTSVKFDYSKGSLKDSNIIDEKSQDILGMTKGLDVVVGNKYKINANKYDLQKEGLQLTVINQKIPPANCYDCLTVFSLEVKKGQQNSTLSFQSGGIEGKIEDQQEAMGYLFKLITADKESYEILVGKK